MKRILFCASTVSHINNFHLPYLKAFHDMGYEVHVVTNEAVPIQWADKVYKIPFHKSFMSFKNISALIQIKKLLKEGSYEKISSNTTLAGLITRLSALFMKARPRIYHIVHGYHFSFDSGVKKYVYLIPEKIASYVSDVVMVMNGEDFDIAQKYKLYKSKLCFIDGIGIDQTRFVRTPPDIKSKMRTEMAIPQKDFVFIYAAEFSRRKNQQLLIRGFAECSFENSLLLLAGEGTELERCKLLVKKLNRADHIKFLGYVKNVPLLYSLSDAAVSVSRSEGLPFNVVEAMGCGLPVIASDIKGHRELVTDGENGLLFENGNMQQLASCLEALYSADQKKLNEYGDKGSKIAEIYTLKHVEPKVMQYYLS